jgi:Cu-Zn family superoxide dismutase
MCIGNIEADDEGVANISTEDRQVKLIGPHSVIGKLILMSW